MKLYRGVPTKAFNKQIDWDSDAVVWTLHTNSYVPNLDTHAFVSDLTNELATGGGYTAGTASGGGLAIVSPTMTYTAANSWGVSRAASTAYVVGDVVRPASANGFLYMATNSGSSGASLPTYPTVLGQSVVDSGVTWECIGSGITVFGCSDPSWSTFTAGPCRYAVASDRTSASNATNPLIGLVDFGSDKTGGGLAFTIQLHAALRAFYIVAP